MVSEKQFTEEARAKSRALYDELMSLSPIPMNFKGKKAKIISVGENYTPVFEGLIGKNIDPENLSTDYTLWKMSATKDVYIDTHSHPMLESYWVIRGEIIEKITNTRTLENQQNIIKKNIDHDIEIKKGTIFIIKWKPRLKINS